MANVAVIGAQWGDEGKGKVVDWLASRADIVVRFQGGHNAGHTLVVGNETYKLSLLPSGLVRGKLGIIGNGVVVDPEALLAEIERVRAQGLDGYAGDAADRRERHADPAAASGARPGARGGARRPQDRHHRARHRPGLRGQGRAAGHPGRRSGRAARRWRTSWTSCCCTTTRCCKALVPRHFPRPTCSPGCSRWRRRSCRSPSRCGSGWTRRGGPAGASCSRARRR